MSMSLRRVNRQRRGAIAVLAAVLLVVMLGMIAFAVDIGYLSLAKTQLQVAADSSALAAAASNNLPRDEMQAVAQQFASANRVSGRAVQLSASDIEFGTWDAGTRKFTLSDSVSSAVRVTVRTNAANGGATPLFFAKIFGKTSQEQSASAIATVNPRDIAFVVDLSRSMNFDTNPSSDSSTSALVQNVYDDFDFGTYPGNSQWAGYPLLTQAESSSWLTNLKTKLTNTSYKGTPYFTGTYNSSQRKYYDADGTTVLSDSTRTKRAYSWVMEQQLPSASLMPNVVPVPNASVTANYNYWKAYIDKYPSSLGYLSYVTLMMDSARDITVAGSYTPLSLRSSLCACPRNDWTVNGESFSFPPREMPTHAARRALIAALQVIRDRNASVSDVNQKDWVSIITFDSASTDTIKWSLTNKDNYAGAMQVAKDFQACGGTGTEGGLALAYNHIKYGTPSGNNNRGRANANKIVVLLTDGQPNDRRSTITSTMITQYMAQNPSTWTNPTTGAQLNNWITSGTDMVDMNAALMQASIMRSENWYVYAAGIGRGCDYNFMDCVARQGLTAGADGQSPRGSDDPAFYENKLREIFESIITNPKLRLVQ